MAFVTGSCRLPPMNEPLKSTVICLLLVCAVLLLYGSSLDAGFINYDDGRVLLNHPELYGQQHFADSLRAILRDGFPREEPLLVRDISWALDGLLFGFGRAAGYHFTNVLLHGFVTACLYLFLWLTTRRRGFSLAVTILFLSLAVHVEPVVWVMGRKDLLASLFVLLALIFQCGALADQGRVRILWHGLCLGCFVLAVLSKINAVVAPVVFFLHWVWFDHLRGRVPGHRPASTRRIWRGAVPVMLPFAAVAAVTYAWYWGVLTEAGVLDRGYNASTVQHLWTLVKVDPMVLLRYLDLILKPNDLSLFYVWPDHNASFSALQIAGSFCVLLTLVAVAVFLWRRHRDLAFYFFTFFALMSPYLNLAYFGIWLANRYVYLASFSVLALAIEAVRRAGQRFGLPARLAGNLVLTVSFGVNLLTNVAYQSAWRTGETLWRYEIGLPATRVYAFDNLASLYYSSAAAASTAEEREAALAGMDRVFRAAEARFGQSDTAVAKLHYLYHLKALSSQLQKQPPDEQLRYLRRAFALNPRYAPTLFELAVHYYRRALEAQGAARVEAVKTSLDYFRRYMRYCLKDRATLRTLAEMRTAYARDFPFVDAGRLEVRR